MGDKRENMKQGLGGLGTAKGKREERLKEAETKAQRCSLSMLYKEKKKEERIPTDPRAQEKKGCGEKQGMG